MTIDSDFQTGISGVALKFYENAGHPWRGSIGFDQQEAHAQMPESMRELKSAMEQEHWACWVSDDEEAWFYRPNGYDPAVNQGWTDINGTKIA